MRTFSIRGAVALVAAAMFTGSLGASSMAAESGVGIRLMDVRPEQVGDPRESVYLIDEANPGSRIERRIRVTNRSDERRMLELYAAAATAEDGWAVADGRGGNQLAQWIELSPSSVTLEPRASTIVTATIQVPADASGGERYAAIVAEPPATETSSGVSVIGRVGLRVYLFVNGEGVEPVSDFEIDTLTSGRSEAGEPYVLIGVTNTGQRALDIIGELRLREGPAGITAGPFPVVIPRTVAPGYQASLQVRLDPAIPAGPWSARADLSSGRLERSAEATIVLPDEAGATSDPVEATPIFRDRGFLVPLAVGLLILALALVLLVWFLAKRRRDDADDEEAATEAEATVGAAE